ncbi:MAG: hypothetical protein AABW63_01765 [Nanoarchaeota archaeon]
MEADNVVGGEERAEDYFANFTNFTNFEMARAIETVKARGIEIEFKKNQGATFARTSPNISMQYRVVPLYHDEKGIPSRSPDHGVHTIPSGLDHINSMGEVKYHTFMFIEEPRSLHWQEGIL